MHPHFGQPLTTEAQRHRENFFCLYHLCHLWINTDILDTGQPHFGHLTASFWTPVLHGVFHFSSVLSVLSVPCFCPCGRHNCTGSHPFCRYLLFFNLKFRRRVARGNPELSGFPPQTNNCFPQLATGGPPGVIQRRNVGRQRRNSNLHTTIRHILELSRICGEKYGKTLILLAF